jgi:hypothetical protein
VGHYEATCLSMLQFDHDAQPAVGMGCQGHARAVDIHRTAR